MKNDKIIKTHLGLSELEPLPVSVLGNHREGIPAARLQVRESRFRPLTVPMDDWRSRMKTCRNPTY